jgi:hypothetical protein
MTVVRAALAALPLSEAQKLYVSGVYQLDINWSKFLQHLPQIQQIYFWGSLPYELMKALKGGESMTMGPIGPLVPLH